MKIIFSRAEIESATFRLHWRTITVERDEPTTPSGVIVVSGIVFWVYVPTRASALSECASAEKKNMNYAYFLPRMRQLNSDFNCKSSHSEEGQ